METNAKKDSMKMVGEKACGKVGTKMGRKNSLVILKMVNLPIFGYIGTKMVTTNGWIWI